MKNYTLYTQTGGIKKIRLSTEENINNYLSDDIQFYTSQDSTNQFNWNGLLKRWETKLTF